MKYIVNTRTKEHRVHTDEYFEDADVWRIVEADADGWIPWEGGDCPLPDYCMCEVQLADGERLSPLQAKRYAWERDLGPGAITHYLPILEAAEKEEPRRHGRTIVHIPESQQSVFDRLKSAIAASESIPAIIAEIDAMLPEGYCVTRCDVAPAGEPAKQPAEDMSDWRNWKEGDLVTAHGLRGGYTENVFPENVPHTIVAKCLSGFDVKSSNGDVLYFNGREISRGELKFHSRPAKVTE